MAELRVVRGDITKQHVDAIVTAANSALRGGGGVDGVVHAAAGPQLLDARRSLAPCPPGSAVITPAFDLAPIRWVIHAVGPIYSGPGDACVLASAYTAALARADEVGAQSIAFPSISTGAYHYPPDLAARISVQALRGAQTAVLEIVLVAYQSRTKSLWDEAVKSSPQPN
jgi:O-acetyl-ADP-ribose deacetylase